MYNLANFMRYAPDGNDYYGQGAKYIQIIRLTRSKVITKALDIHNWAWGILYLAPYARYTGG